MKPLSKWGLIISCLLIYGMIGLVRGKGSYVWDAQGNKYLDLVVVLLLIIWVIVIHRLLRQFRNRPNYDSLF